MLPFVTKYKYHGHFNSLPLPVGGDILMWWYFGKREYYQVILVVFPIEEWIIILIFFSFACVSCLEINLSCFKLQRRTRPDSFQSPSHHTTQDLKASVRLPTTQYKTRQLQYAYTPHNTRPNSYSTPSLYTNQDPTASVRLPCTQLKTQR
jgi:hypothetical protein